MFRRPGSIVTHAFLITALLAVTALAGCGPGVVRTGTTIRFGSRTITKDFWGAPQDEDVTAEVHLGSNNTFGWSWDRENPLMKPGLEGVLPIYPNARVGADIGQSSNTRAFPLKTKDIRQLTLGLDYRYKTPPSGRYNLAYEMLFSDSRAPGPDATPKAEVMIWIHHTFGQPPSSYQGDFTDGSNDYELYSWTMADGRVYSCFAMKGTPDLAGEHTVDAAKLLADLKIDPSWYLLGVQIGNEILDGSGDLEISRLEVLLNGKRV